MSSQPSRNSIPVITKYELTMILAERTAKLADGAPTTIANPGTNNPKEIALLEYKAGKLPSKLLRQWPNGNKETWGLNELQHY